MARDPTPTWFFALVVVRQGDRFLLVHERKHGQPWYFPAGRAEQGESLANAARRETLEEAGVEINLTGILRVEHSPSPNGSCVRVIFVAEAAAGQVPKTTPDDESLGAAWVSLDELAEYPLRGAEVEQIMRAVGNGARAYPLDLLQPEGLPFMVRA